MPYFPTYIILKKDRERKRVILNKRLLFHSPRSMYLNKALIGQLSKGERGTHLEPGFNNRFMA